MTIHRFIVNYIQASHKHEAKCSWLSKLFYLSPSARIQRLDDIFDTTQFSESALARISNSDKICTKRQHHREKNE